MKYDTQHIDKYLNGELSQTQAKAFEEQMQSDTDFAYEVKLQQTAIEAVQYSNFMTKIKNVREEIAIKEAPISIEVQKEVANTPRVVSKPKRPGIIRRLAPAIAFAAAALIALLIWQPWQQSLYTPYVLKTTQMSSGKQALKEAQDTYNSGDYATALPLLEKFSNNISVQIAKANAEYNLKQYDAAAATLQPIASGNSAYKNTANWYLALTYLKQDQSEKAKAALKEIKSGDYYDGAQKLLKKIK